MTSTLEFLKLIEIKKNWTLLLSHRTHSYICMYINAVANNVMLQ